MPILCEHAHALNASLRLNALWALKHFVQAARNDLKKACLEELESGWLVQLICDDTEDDALYSSRPKGIMSDIMDEDIEMEQSEEQPRSWMAKSHIQLERIPAIREAGAILADLRDVELNPVRKARSDDLAIQEQGLDFIRNLIGSADSSGLDASNDAAEMIDHLLETFGADRLFRILANKLRTKTVPSLPNNGSSSKRIPGGTSAARELRRLYPQAKIIESVIFILVHMAASVPRHRQMVMAQTELLRSLRQHFASRDKEVRVALCHLVGNLTWKDDAADEPYCAGRIRELRDLGFQARLEQLEHDDPELDVRERAKGALCQMRQGSGNGSSGGGAASSSSSGVGVGAGAGVSAATTATF